MYITKEAYAELYGPMEDGVFARLSIEACRVMDIHTTGIDNVKKLKRFFPTDEDSAEAVRHCAARIISTLKQIQDAEAVAMEGRGYESTEQGMRGKVISSVSAGNESISYTTGSTSASTAIDEAVKDRNTRDKLLAGIVREYLRGIEDDNGVGLLFMGMYPRRFLC